MQHRPPFASHRLALLAGLGALHLWLMGISACPSTDQDGDGWTSDSDCDDSDPAIHPGALEVCDGKDNDCDAQIDEGTTYAGYPDQDRDGFGTGPSVRVACGANGYAPARGDCDDTDSGVHPGADDPAGDGIDQDCGGTEGPEPHVGLSGASLISIQAALDAAASGVTVWVGPGVYPEYEVSFAGKAVHLASTHPAAQTVIDAQHQGIVMLFNSNEGPGSILDGFTLTGGSAGDGGGAWFYKASPTLLDCVISGNVATEFGGGLYLSGSSPTLTRCAISGNVATDYANGGGIYIWGGQPVLTDCRITDNTADWYGGGLYLDTLGTLTRCTISGNSAGMGGGGLFLSAGHPVLENTLITANSTPQSGGGLYLEKASSPLLTSCTIAGNRAIYHGGGMYVLASSPVIKGSILAYNLGYDLYLDTGSTADVTGSDLFSPSSIVHNLPALDASNRQVDPGFVWWSIDGEARDDAHLRPGSPLLGALTGVSNPDGTPAELGAFGGPKADRGYYADSDQDGLYDGWELSRSTDLATFDGASDPDGDGLPDQKELELSCDPAQADTDGDGAADGTEVAAGSLPTDWYSQPGVPAVTAHVPGDFPSIQEAVDHIAAGGTIVVGAGTWLESLRIEGRRLTLTSEAGAGTTILQGNGSSVISALSDRLELTGFTVTGGKASIGAGLFLSNVEGRLESLVVTGNDAGPLGSAAGTAGGGLALWSSSPDIVDSRIEDNIGSKGGGIYLNGSSPTVTRCLFRGNQSTEGGGAHMRASRAVFEGCVFEDNTLSEAGTGGGLWLRDSEGTLSHCLITGNTADEGGGGISMYESDPVIRNCLITDNLGDHGGALSLTESSPSIIQSVIAGNHSLNGLGGISTYSVSPLELVNSIVAYNAGYNLFIGSSSSLPIVLYSDLFNPTGLNHDLPALDPSSKTIEPGFLAYEGGTPTDLHLSKSSRLIDLGDPATKDVDGSRSDMGGFGGGGGDGWDLDRDGLANWFWPGTIDDVPAGFDRADFDADDRDAGVQ